MCGEYSIWDYLHLIKKKPNQPKKNPTTQQTCYISPAVIISQLNYRRSDRREILARTKPPGQDYLNPHSAVK